MNLTTPPPGKLSELIDLAIADARRIDRGDYTPDAGAWHEHGAEDRCVICLAGAVIAATLGCPKDARIGINCENIEVPGTTTISNGPWQHALWALNDARAGAWAEALRTLGQAPAHETHRLQDRLGRIAKPTHPDFRNWTQFDRHLDSLADRAKQLRKLGL